MNTYTKIRIKRLHCEDDVRELEENEFFHRHLFISFNVKSSCQQNKLIRTIVQIAPIAMFVFQHSVSSTCESKFSELGNNSILRQMQLLIALITIKEQKAEQLNVFFVAAVPQKEVQFTSHVWLVSTMWVIHLFSLGHVVSCEKPRNTIMHL